MNLFALIKPAFVVLREGQSLTNAASWKNAQTLGNLLAALVAILGVCGVRLGLSNDDVMLIAGAIAALANAYVTVATSTKVGVPAIELQGKATPYRPVGTSVPVLDERVSDDEVQTRDETVSSIRSTVNDSYNS